MKKQKLTQKSRNRFSLLFFPIIGLLALIWFLVRVIPKPSRASYPCQRIAAGIGGGFIAYLLGSFGLVTLMHKFRYKLARYRSAIFTALAISFVLAGAFLAPKFISSSGLRGYTPIDPANQPMGEAKGLYPGRVAWVQDRQATPWDGASGFWWNDSNTDQAVVDSILSRSLKLFSGEPDIGSAWEAIFQHFNQAHGQGSVGYQAGEKIVIKINSNQDGGAAWDNGGYQSPHLVYSLINQLINVVGVSGSDITIADSSRYIGDPIYNKIRANPDPDFQAVTFVVKPAIARNGRVAAVQDYSKPIHFVKPYPTDPNICVHYPPLCYTQATYLINLALLRCHTLFGATLCAKNHFGSVFNGEEFRPQKLHGSGIIFNPPNELGNPHCHPVLIGHGELGGKTLLYLIDGIYTAIYQGSKDIVKWQTLGNDWCSSLLVSQDPVAIDSVALDFLRCEPNMQVPALTVDTCNYLHESALADNPPSQAFYDPDNDGVRLQSLGTHEHWNNVEEKMYSRNLGTGSGIELVRDCSGIDLLSPAGGEVLQQGAIRQINWQANKLKEDIKISLWKDGVRIGLISANVNPDVGTFAWPVGAFVGGTAAPGSGYRIKLKEQKYSYSDLSDADFTIAELTVTSPNGGESLIKDSTHTITWQASYFSTHIKITLWQGDTRIGVIAPDLDPGPGSFNWNVGDYAGGSADPGAGYRIKIKARNLRISDFSDSAFSIVN